MRSPLRPSCNFHSNLQMWAVARCPTRDGVQRVSRIDELEREGNVKLTQPQ
jgi:hypothetical protein